MCNYKALDIADYVVLTANALNKDISHLQLQKILYFLEAEYLVEGKQLFTDEISKWRLGPVVETVYHHYKTFGSSNISYIPKRVDLESGFLKFKEFDASVIDIKDKEKIKSVMMRYIDIPPFDLVNATHEHLPWKNDENAILLGQQNLKYDKDELKLIFSQDPTLFEVN